MREITIKIPDEIYIEMVEVINRPENKKFKVTYGDWICHFISGYKGLEAAMKSRDAYIEKLSSEIRNLKCL
jgi:hypothetical protein